MNLKTALRSSLLLALVGGVASFGSAYSEDFNDWNLQGNDPSSTFIINIYSDNYNLSDTNGWTILGDPGTGIDLIGGYQTIPENDVWVDLAGTPGPGGIAKTFAFNVGQTYTISFLGLSNDGEGLQVGVNGATIADYSADDLTADWTSHSVSFTATSSSENISFYTGDPTDGNVGLDSISIQPAPEPISTLLLGGVLLTALKKRLKI